MTARAIAIAIALPGTAGGGRTLLRPLDPAFRMILRSLPRLGVMLIPTISRGALVSMKSERRNVAVCMALKVRGRAPAELERHNEHQDNGEKTVHGWSRFYPSACGRQVCAPCL